MTISKEDCGSRRHRTAGRWKKKRAVFLLTVLTRARRQRAMPAMQLLPLSIQSAGSNSIFPIAVRSMNRHDSMIGRTKQNDCRRCERIVRSNETGRHAIPARVCVVAKPTARYDVHNDDYAGRDSRWPCHSAGEQAPRAEARGD